ncbi:MAG TPA: helix-turn-helix transcriptional regulator [Solirubrobacteraceae bacterium]|nr:helix-turn-helix transcriptional regulator [Solirubrobacteraceae bacterium]
MGNSRDSLYVNVIEVAIRRRKAACVVSLEFQAPQIKAALGQAVRRRRDELGLTQEELFEECGIPANSISRTENGKGNITYFNLKRLAAGLGVPASQILAHAEKIEKAAMSPDAQSPAADPQASAKAPADARRKAAKAPAEPRKTVRERRSQRDKSAPAAEKP